MLKIFYDYFPIVCFFVAYKLYGIYVATEVTIVASTLQVAAFWIKNRRFEQIHLITLVLVILLGGATLLLHKEIFIKLKPTVVYWIFSVVLFASHYRKNGTALERLLGKQLALPKRIWRHLNAGWSIFFFAMGLLNLYIALSFSTDSWVNFKLFGTLGGTILFVIGQAFYMHKHLED